jgi:hypothetical protein
MIASVDCAALKRRLDRLITLRQPHEPNWRDCFDHSFPIRGSGLEGGTPLDAQQAADRRARLLHSFATDAGRTLAAALVSGTTPSSSVWGTVAVASADDEGKRWLEEKSKQLHEEIHASTFDAAAYESCLDLVPAGWFALYVEEANGGGLAFSQWTLSQCYCAASVSGGLIDTIFRKYTLTAEQAHNEFAGKVSPRVQKMIDDKQLDAEVSMVHAIYPRAVYMPGARMAKNMRFVSVHFEADTCFENRESGYHEFPVIVPRWSLIPNSVYAIGPMFDALPDARELNAYLGINKTAAALRVSGMWVAEDDGVLNPRTVKLRPGGIIVANDVESIKRLDGGGDWQMVAADIQLYAASIRKVLMADQLQPVDGPAMTATEVHVRVAMIRQLLGPIYGRLQAEYLAPLVERCFGIMMRAGVFGQAPQSLGGQNFQVKYNNPLARAQRMEDVNAIERLNGNLQGLAALGEVAPAAAASLDVIDFDANVRTLVDGLGVPLKNTRNLKQLAQYRAERAKQQAEAQQAAQGQEMQTLAAETMSQRAVKAA